MNPNEYQDTMKKSLQSMNARISDLESKLDEVDDKITVQRLVDEVKSKRDSVRVKLKRVGNSTDAAWSEIKDGLDGAWSELQTSYDRARSQFSNGAHH